MITLYDPFTLEPLFTGVQMILPFRLGDLTYGPGCWLLHDWRPLCYELDRYNTRGRHDAYAETHRLGTGRRHAVTDAQMQELRAEYGQAAVVDPRSRWHEDRKAEADQVWRDASRLGASRVTDPAS